MWKRIAFRSRSIEAASSWSGSTIDVAPRPPLGGRVCVRPLRPVRTDWHVVWPPEPKQHCVAFTQRCVAHEPRNASRRPVGFQSNVTPSGGAVVLVVSTMAGRTHGGRARIAPTPGAWLAVRHGAIALLAGMRYAFSSSAGASPSRRASNAFVPQLEPQRHAGVTRREELWRHDRVDSGGTRDVARAAETSGRMRSSWSAGAQQDTLQEGVWMSS